MITPIETPWEPDIWRSELQQAIRTSTQLLQYVKVQSEFASDDEPFPVRVPKGFADRMVPGDENDPLLRQVLATTHEQLDTPGFVRDPLEEDNSSNLIHPAPGLLQKYHGRALLISTGACAINCRYCFRRHFPYSEHQQSRHEKALAAAEQAVLTRPSCDVSFAVKASILNYLGRPEEAIPLALFAIRLSPVYPSYYPTVLGYAYFHCGKYREAWEASEISIKADPANIEALILRTAIYVASGSIEKAQETAKAIRDTHPEFSLAAFADRQPYQDQEHLHQILSHLNQTVLNRQSS